MSCNKPIEPIIVSSIDVMSRGYRLDPSQYNADVDRIIRHCKTNRIPLKSIGDLGWIKEVFLPNRFTRNYTGDGSRGVPMLGTSSMLDMKLPTDIRVFKNSVNDFDSLYIQENDILISRSGSVGTSILCGKSYKGFIASDDCFRIRADIDHIGYIAAYLKTEYGLTLLTKDSHGKVIKHLKPNDIFALHIFQLDKDLITLINSKMIESKEKFDLSREYYAEVENLLQKSLGKYTPQVYPKGDIIPSTTLFNMRLDPHMYDPFTNYMAKQIKKKSAYQPLKELANVWGVPRFKRYYVDEDSGTGLYSSSDIVRAEINPSKYISNHLNRQDIEKCQVTKDMILIPCSGAYGGILGKGIMSTVLLDNKPVSQHVLRITPKNEKDRFFYIGAFLCSNTFGYPLITGTRFGKDIPELDIKSIAEIPIPQLGKSQEEAIAQKFKAALELQVAGNQLERQATEMIKESFENQ